MIAVEFFTTGQSVCDSSRIRHYLTKCEKAIEFVTTVYDKSRIRHCWLKSVIAVEFFTTGQSL
jgi:hypothetical protein